MICSEIKSVVYDEQKDQLIFEDVQGEIEIAEVYIDHENEIIRVYNIPVKLTDSIKNQILFAFINRAMLVPGSLFTLDKTKNAIENYTLLFNGYQFNGEMVEFGNKYKKTYSIIENFIENSKACDEDPEIIKNYRTELHDICMKYLYENHSYDAVSFKVTGKQKIRRVMSYMNIIQTYLRKKGYDVCCRLNDDILFFKYIKFEVLPNQGKVERKIAYDM